MHGLVLGEAGREAMAEELLRIASDGQRSWDSETPKLRAELRSYIDAMVDSASAAEERQANTRARRVLP